VTSTEPENFARKLYRARSFEASNPTKIPHLAQRAAKHAAKHQCELLVTDIVDSLCTPAADTGTSAATHQVECSELIAEAALWPQIACQVNISDFGSFAAVSFTQFFADAAQSSVQHGGANPPDSAVLQYLTDSATTILKVS
jgi:hypothetical protein